MGAMVSLLVLAVTVPVLVRTLGARGYGAWVLTGGIAQYLLLFDFGLSLSVARFVSRERVRNPRFARQAIVVGACLVACIGALVFATTIALADPWAARIGVDGAGFAFIAGGASCLLFLVSAILQAAAEGAGAVGPSRILQTCATLLFAVAAIPVAILADEKLRALGIVLLVQSTFLMVALTVLVRRVWGGWPVAAPSRAAFKEVTGYALVTQSGSLLTYAIDPLSRILIGATSGASAVAALDIALRVRSQWFGSAVAFLRPVLPAFGEFSSRERAAHYGARLWLSFVPVAVAAGLGLAAAVYWLAGLIFGEVVGAQAGPLAATAVIFWIPSVVGVIPYTFLLVHRGAGAVLAVQAATALTGIVAMLLLVRPYGEWAGVVGLGMGAVLGAGVTLALARNAEGSHSFATRHLVCRANAAGLIAGLVTFSALALLPTSYVARIALAVGGWAIIGLPLVTALYRAWHDPSEVRTADGAEPVIPSRLADVPD